MIKLNILILLNYNYSSKKFEKLKKILMFKIETIPKMISVQNRTYAWKRLKLKAKHVFSFLLHAAQATRTTISQQLNRKICSLLSFFPPFSVRDSLYRESEIYVMFSPVSLLKLDGWKLFTESDVSFVPLSGLAVLWFRKS